MPIKPKPFLAKCPKCGNTTMITPKSDVINPIEIFPRCESCGEAMKKIDLAQSVDLGVEAIKDVCGKIFGKNK